MVVIIVFLVVTGVLCVIFLAYLVDTMHNGLAPNLATPVSAYEEISKALDIKRGDCIMDIGCGNAKLISYCAIKYPLANFKGIDNGLIANARARLNTIKNKNVMIQFGNFVNLSNLKPNKYYMYLLPETLEIIKPKLSKGCLVVSLEYPFRGVKPIISIKLESPTALAHRLYVYKF